jgi:hypothetical protein
MNQLSTRSRLPRTVFQLFLLGTGFTSFAVYATAPFTFENTGSLSGKRLRLMGSLFQGISQASSANTQDSSSNYPIVQLRRLDNDHVTFLPVDPQRGWSDSSFTSRPVKDFPPGPARVTVFTNGIPSESKILTITTP